jgi:hypothetical protein
MRNADNILVGKPQGNRPFGRPRHRWEDIVTVPEAMMEWCGLNLSGSG